MVKKIAESTADDQSVVRKGIYEIGYHMVPTIAEENLGEEVTALKDLLSLNGAIFISDEYPRLMELAYEMTRSIANKKNKFTTGYFGWIKFECTPQEAKSIKELLDKYEKIIRYLLIKTVRENTMSPKRTYAKQDNKKRISARVKESSGIEETTETIEVVDEAEIDKEIDALVV